MIDTRFTKATFVLSCTLVGLVPGIATAEPTEATPEALEGIEETAEPPAAAESPSPVDPAPTQPSKSWIPEEAWTTAQEQPVILELEGGGEIRGKLANHAATTAVLIQADGRVVVVEKATVVGLRIEQAATTPPSGAQPQPGDTSPTSPPTQPPPPANPGSKREFAMLGFFVSQGAGFAHWSGADSGGTVAYAADLGLGFNASKGLGFYAVGGGLFAGRLFEKEVKANYGHLAAAFAGRGRYFGAMLGIGVAFSSLVAVDDDEQSFKDLGLAVPFKMQGFIPLPKNLYIGIGLGYDFAGFQKFDLIFNGVSGFISFGRW